MFDENHEDNSNKDKMLKITYIPYDKIMNMNRDDRVAHILSLLKSERILIIGGRLDSRDEAILIRETMNCINERFCGIEIGILHDHEKKSFVSRFKRGISNPFKSQKSGLTMIGPASIISEMRSDTEDIVLHFGTDYLKKHLAVKKAK